MVERREFIRQITLVALLSASGGSVLKAAEGEAPPPSPAEVLRYAVFAPLQGASFTVGSGDESQEMILEHVVRVERGPQFECFTLEFHGAVERSLAEAIHAFHHPQVGRLDLFLTPRREENGRRYYDVVIYRLV